MEIRRIRLLCYAWATSSVSADVTEAHHFVDFSIRSGWWQNAVGHKLTCVHGSDSPSPLNSHPFVAAAASGSLRKSTEYGELLRR
mmetsp:Transcript_16116/g.46475  ORF Transcript_16116/g.46475 Transcript_16116/m.46475 type:complete len:85 (-) Transcript_16116:1189-1443(-)